MTKSRWANWSRGTEDKRGFGSFVKEATDSGNPTGTGTMSPAERARSLGLQSNGSGGYIDPETGQVVARTVNNELVFYDNRGATGGVVSDGEGGQQLANAQPSWRDPKTGMLTTPPAQPESPEEIAAVPDATPAVAPMGYNDFMKKKKEQAYAEPEEMVNPGEMNPEMAGGDMGVGEAGGMMGEDYEPENLAKRMSNAYDKNLEKSADRVISDVRASQPKPQVQQQVPQVKKQPEVAPERPRMSQQPTADEEREAYDWAAETRAATMKNLQERYAGTAREKQSIDKAITSRYEPLQKLLSEIEDPDVRDRQARAFVNAMSTRHRNNNGTNAMTAAQYEGLANNREKLQGLDFDEDGNHDFERIKKFKNDMIIHDDISDDYVMATYDLLPDHVRGSLTHTSRNKLSPEELDRLQEKYPLAKRRKDYMDYSPVFWKQYLQTGGIDAYTGQHLDINDLNIEHILPGVSGNAAGKGSDLYEWTEDPDNKVLVHRAPNQLKGDRALKDFLDRQLADYDPNQADLYDFRADADQGAQGAKMKTRSFDIENLANLLLDFGPDGKQEGVYKEDLTPEKYDQIINEHQKQYEELKGPILKAFHDKFDPEDLGYHKLTPKKLEARLKEEGKEDQLGRYMMMRDVFNQVSGLKPNLGQINKNMKIGKKTLPASPRTDPAHGGQATGSSKTREAMVDAFTKSFLGKDRATQEAMKRSWNEAVESGSNASRLAYNDEASEPDFYRRKEKTQFLGLQAFHKKLQESGFMDDGVLDREEFAALKRDMGYHRDTSLEDHMSIFDSAEKDSKGRAKPNWFNKYLDGLMNESFDYDEDEDETLEDSSMDGLLRALSRLMQSEGEVMSESPMSFSDFMSAGSQFMREDYDYFNFYNLLEDEEMIGRELPKVAGRLRAGMKVPAKTQSQLKKQKIEIEDGKIRAHQDWKGKDQIPQTLRGPDIERKTSGRGKDNPNIVNDSQPDSSLGRRMRRYDDIRPDTPGISPRLIDAMDTRDMDLGEFEEKRFEAFGDSGLRLPPNQGTAGTDIKESGTLYAMMEQLQHGKQIDEDDLQFYINGYMEKYGMNESDAKTRAQATRQQVRALSDYLDARGITEEQRKAFLYAKVGGTDTDIPQELQADGVMDKFTERLGEFLSTEERQKLFGSHMKDAWNPTDILFMSPDLRDRFEDIYEEIFSQYEGASVEEKRNAINLVAAAMRNEFNSGNLLPISLKDSAGKEEVAKEYNVKELSDKGMEAIAATLLEPATMKMMINNDKVGGTDFTNNDLLMPFGLQVNANYLGDESEELDPEEMKFFAHYMLQEGNKSDEEDYRKIKNEPKPLRNSGQDTISTHAEKYGSVPVKVLEEQIKRVRNLPEGEDGSYMMGVSPRLYPEPKEYKGARYPEAGPKPVKGPRQSDESYQKKLDAWQKKKEVEGQFKPTAKYEAYLEEKERAGTAIPDKYDYKDLGDDEIEYWGDRLEQISDYNDESDFKVDLSSTNIGDREYGKGQYRDFMRDLAKLDRAFGLTKSDPKNEEAKEIIEGFFGEGSSTRNNRFRAKTRLLLNRIALAHGFGQAHKDGNLQKEIADAFLSAQKIAQSRELSGFPMLKIGGRENLEMP